MDGFYWGLTTNLLGSVVNFSRRAIGLKQNTVFAFALRPFSRELIPVGPSEDSLSIFKVILPAADIGASVCVSENAISNPHVVLETAFVATSIGICRNACATSLILHPVSLVPDIFIRPCVFTVSVLLVHDPLAFVAVGSFLGADSHLALTIALIVGPSARVNRFIAVDH